VDLTGYMDLLRRRWRIAALIVLLSVGVALVVTQLQQRRYQSTVGMVVSGSSPTTSGETAGRDLAAARAAAFAQLVATDAVLPSAEQAAGEELGKPVAKADIGVHASSSGALLTVRVTADDPDAALAVARAMPLVLPGQLAKLNQLPAVSGGPLLTVVTPATRASHPSAPHPLRNLLIGLAAGALLAAAVPLIRVRATGARGVRDSTEIAGLARGNVLGVVPREFEADRLAVASRPRSPRSAAYRDIQAKLAGADQQLGSFVVTSAERGAGRSTVTANLAVLFGRTGRRVAVIDADLREPTLASIFNLASRGCPTSSPDTGCCPSCCRRSPGTRSRCSPAGARLPIPTSLLPCRPWPRCCAPCLRSSMSCLWTGRPRRTGPRRCNSACSPTASSSSPDPMGPTASGCDARSAPLAGLRCGCWVSSSTRPIRRSRRGR
jgi:polysaccharide biosynthesis transport protein